MGSLIGDLERNYYLELDESNRVAEDLLKLQYNDNLAAFLIRLYNITEKLIPKKNSMMITGPPNSGKTFFFDMVTSFYLNVGTVANIVRGEHFPLNDCIHRRILMWNEPNCCLSAWEMVKMLTGGDSCPAKIKYQGDQIVSRTPLIITSNKDFIRQNQYFETRVYFEKWNRASFLANINQKLNPLTFTYLINKYVLH